MKKIILAVLLTTAASAASAETYVRGYTRSDGTYVQPHHRSSPDGNINNNWSTQGNVNPYTGQHGTVSPQGVYIPPAPTYVPAPVYGRPRY
jgi:hypothetical protein